MKRCFLFGRTSFPLLLLTVGLSVSLLSACNLDFSADGLGITPELPELTSPPYMDPGDVWISRGFELEHGGIDFAAHATVPIRAPVDGVFHKEMYYHAGVPRWQVNAEVRSGKYGVEMLFEPGDFVTEAEAAVQFDMLLDDGTPVSAGDPLGSLYLVPGQEKAYVHLAVRLNATGEFFCPLLYSTPDLQAELLDLFHRDHPDGLLCYDQGY